MGGLRTDGCTQSAADRNTLPYAGSTAAVHPSKFPLAFQLAVAATGFRQLGGSTAARVWDAEVSVLTLALGQ